MLFVLAALARRLGVPFRSGGNFTASKVPDYQAAYESAISFMATMQAGVNFNLHTAGWLEGGLAIGYEKFILDEDQASMAERVHRAASTSTENGYALDAMLAGGPGQHFLGSPHTLANFENAFWRSELSDNDSFEQWELDGVARRGAAGQRALEAAPGGIQSRRSTRASTRSCSPGSTSARRASPTPTSTGAVVSRSGRGPTDSSTSGAAWARSPAAVDCLGLTSPEASSSAGVFTRAPCAGPAAAQLLERDVALIRCPGSTSTSGGSVTSHRPGITRGQRVWNTQPVGGFGGARDLALEADPRPLLAVDARDGRQQRLGVRVVGAAEDRLRSPTSWIRPRYMTAIRSAR